MAKKYDTYDAFNIQISEKQLKEMLKTKAKKKFLIRIEITE